MDEINIKDQLAALLKEIRAQTAKMEVASANMDRITAKLDGFTVKPVTTLDASSPAATTTMVIPVDGHHAVLPSSSHSAATPATDAVLHEGGDDNVSFDHSIDNTGCVTAPVTATSGETELVTAPSRAATRPAPVPAIGEPLAVGPVATIYTVDVVPAACSTECAAQTATVSTKTAFLPWSSVWSSASPTTSATKGVVTTDLSHDTITTEVSLVITHVVPNDTTAVVHTFCLADCATQVVTALSFTPATTTAPLLWPAPSASVTDFRCYELLLRPTPWPSFLVGQFTVTESRPRPWPSFLVGQFTVTESRPRPWPSFTSACTIESQKHSRLPPLATYPSLVQWKPRQANKLTCVATMEFLLGNACMKPMDTSFTAVSSCMLQLVVFSGAGASWSYYCSSDNQCVQQANAIFEASRGSRRHRPGSPMQIRSGAAPSFLMTNFLEDIPVGDVYGDIVPLPYPYLSQCHSSKPRLIPWPSFADLSGGVNTTEPMSPLHSTGGKIFIVHELHCLSYGLSWIIPLPMCLQYEQQPCCHWSQPVESVLRWKKFVEHDPVTAVVDCLTATMSNNIGVASILGTVNQGEQFTELSVKLNILERFLRKQHAQARVCYLHCSSSVLGWLSVDSGVLLIWGLTETAYRLPLEVPCSEGPAPSLALANFAMVWQIAWYFISGGSSSDNMNLGGNEILIVRFRRVTLLGPLGSAYNLFPGGTCAAHKVQNLRKFTSSNHLHEDTYIKAGHLNSPFGNSTPVASHYGGEGKELAHASPIWLVAWTVDGLEFSTGYILVCTPEHGLFPWHGHLRYLSSWIHVEYVEKIPSLTGSVATGHRHGSDLDHYWSVLTMNERPEQYRYSVKILGHELTQEGATLVTWLIPHQTFEASASSYVLSIFKHLGAPWDPGGGILHVFADCGLRTSRKLRRGECQVPTVTWAERWAGPAVSTHTKGEPALHSYSLVLAGLQRGVTTHGIGIDDQTPEPGSISCIPFLDSIFLPKALNSSLLAC